MALIVADQRILRATAATLFLNVTDQDGLPADAAGAVTVTVRTSAGTALVTNATAAHVYTGLYRASLTAAQTASLDILTATWHDAGAVVDHVTTAEVAGRYYFTVQEARDFDKALANDAAFPNDKVVRARRQVEDECERITGRAFVPRFRIVELWGNGLDILTVPDEHLRAVRRLQFGALEMADVSIANVIASGDGTIRQVWPYSINGIDEQYGRWGARFPERTLVTVAYEHGLDQPPADLKRATMLRLRYLLAAEASGIPDRATSFSVSEGGVFSLATAGRAGFDTGIPEVDATYGRYKRADNTAGSVPIG